MRNQELPFQFDLRNILARARRNINDHVSGITINLPFVSFSVKPESTEKKIAKELVIRIADKRVLNSFECCDECINQALASLQEIRSLLVDKQVELANLADGSLYLLIELMLEAIRQFFTFTERLKFQQDFPLELPSHFPVPDKREKYFAALEMLRAHLHRCLIQISKIANTKIPKISDNMRYDEGWQKEAYIRLPKKSS